MRDADLVAFLQWALPRMGLRWEGFRKVRKQVGKRLARRLSALAIAGDAGWRDAYRARLEADPGEWRVLDRLCRVTISRFYRDRGVWDALRARALPDLAREARRRGEGVLRVWCCGCASGDAPYTLALAWHLGLADELPELQLVLLATDTDAALLARARHANYSATSLKELPEAWRRVAFAPPAREAESDDGSLELKPELRAGVHLARHDVRDGAPLGPCDLVLCRNLVFTYFDAAAQERVARELAAALVPGGSLLLAPREAPPAGGPELIADTRVPGLFHKPA